MATPWIGAEYGVVATKWYDQSIVAAANHVWWDGAAYQIAVLLGWWDGAAIQPVEAIGYWNGTSIAPLDTP